MPGKAPKRKGTRFERELVDLLREWLIQLGIHGEVHRVPLSGSAEGFKGDVLLRLGDYSFTIECKRRSKLPAYLQHPIAAFRQDRGDAYFLFRADQLFRLMWALRVLPLIVGKEEGGS